MTGWCQTPDWGTTEGTSLLNAVVHPNRNSGLLKMALNGLIFVMEGMSDPPKWGSAAISCIGRSWGKKAITPDCCLLPASCFGKFLPTKLSTPDPMAEHGGLQMTVTSKIHQMVNYASNPPGFSAAALVREGHRGPTRAASKKRLLIVLED